MQRSEFQEIFRNEEKHGIEPSLDVTKYYNKDKCAPFYKMHEQLAHEFGQVKNIKTSIFSDIM